MSVVLERLRHLRQQAGLPSIRPQVAQDETCAGPLAGTRRETPGPPSPPVPSSPLPPGTGRLRPEVPEHIRRLLGIRSKGSSARPVALPVPPRQLDRHVPGEQIADGLFYTESFSAWPDAPPTINAAFAKLASIDRRHLLYFDTETTGLAGGTGTRAFMIGAADWRGGDLRLRQLTMTTMAAEPAMLRTFATWLSPQTALVSYNGKCYDAPLLNTRYRLARLPSPLPGLVHLDLLHPSRRRWKGQWENCRLGTLERQVLQVVRDDDLPGSEAPRAWLDYLRGGSARNLRRVAEHNAQDLRSLAGLCLHLSALCEGEQALETPGPATPG